MMENNLIQCERFVIEIRIATLRELEKRGFGHLGGCMSIADLIGVLYDQVLHVDPTNPNDPDRDWLVCSKGHAGPVIYAALALKGFFPVEWLETLNQPGTHLPSHCDRTKTPGIDMTTGSLGQGISMAEGIALGNKLDQRNNYTYCIIGDGESEEGQVWEAVMLASQLKLDHLILFVDNNHEQLDGQVSTINNLEPFSEKFESFGWRTYCCDGHDCGSILNAINCSKKTKGKPIVIILDTVKGKGCPFAIGKPNHHMQIPQKDAEEAILLLRKQEDKLDKEVQQ